MQKMAQKSEPIPRIRRLFLPIMEVSLKPLGCEYFEKSGYQKSLYNAHAAIYSQGFRETSGATL
jgi:hypothetical protein